MNQYSFSRSVVDQTIFMDRVIRRLRQISGIMFLAGMTAIVVAIVFQFGFTDPMWSESGRAGDIILFKSGVVFFIIGLAGLMGLERRKR